MTPRASFRQADLERPPEAVLTAARALGRMMARRVLASQRGALQPPPMPNPER